MKILAIGDPHGKRFKLPDLSPDYVFLPGDISDNPFRATLKGKKFTEAEIEKGLKKIVGSTEQFLKRIRQKYLCPIFLVAGNAEARLGRGIGLSKLAKKYNIKLIDMTVVELGRFKLMGIRNITTEAWKKRFKDMEVKKEELEFHRTLEKHLPALLSKHADIILSHIPPYKVLDKVDNSVAPKAWQGKHAGLIPLREYILKNRPLLCVCSHIHEGIGIEKLGKTIVVNCGAEGQYAVINVDKQVRVKLINLDTLV